jgi:hypothetical protein
MKIGTVNAGFASEGVKEILPEFSTFSIRSVNNPEQ